jgi:hypothetical protein
MHRLSYESVVDQMVHTLAENRRSRMERQAAYVALARAILADNELASAEAGELVGFDTFATAREVAA